MDYSTFLQRAKSFLYQQLNLADYIDVKSAGENVRDSIHFRGPNIYILFVAIIIASVGLNVNSIPVIIGAMLISPLMSPIIGFGMGLGTKDTSLVLGSLKNLGIMFVISLLASTIYFLVTPLETDNPTELLARTRPSIYDVFIAFFGGIAGILELARKQKGTVMAGVAIATALMPPLCTVGYGIAQWNWHYAGGALYLFFINCVFIALATFLAVKFLRFPSLEQTESKSRRSVIVYSLFILVVLVPSFFSAYNIVMENRFSNAASHFVKDNRTIGDTYIFDYAIDTESTPYTVTLRLAGGMLTPDSRAKLFQEAEKYGILSSQILFHEDATIEVRRLNETEIMKDWMATTEQQLKQRDDSIRTLLARMDEYKAAYQSLLLPTNQITKELRAQWPSIDQLLLARADSTILLVVSPKKDSTEYLFQPEDLSRMEQWLKVRLQVPSAQVITR